MDAQKPLTKQLIFQSKIGEQKPFTMREREDPSPCPFCDRSMLPPIIREDGDILLVPNKYPILKNTDPYVLIETADCESELSLYTEDHLIRVFQLAFDAWQRMLADSRYRSVLFLKNHGPLSGGSLRHPHMQLIGLYDIDYHPNIRQEYFYGPVIHETSGAIFNISDHPRIGFTEFNVILKEKNAFVDFCLLIQKAIRYILEYHHNGQIASYNLFFYSFDDIIYCKVMPRYATTPVYMGYAIPQVIDDLASVVKEVQDHCFS